MGISIFPSSAAEFVSNNFVVDMNDTTNNTADTGGVKQAGPYTMNFSSGDTTFDVYLIDEDGNSVGYSNSTSITASGLFSSVVILGVASDEIITFNYSGSVNNADGEGDEPGAGAYLESISPADLPSIDDTANVIGGNFATDVEIDFISGTTVLPAKNIVRTDSTALVVTRPDGLVEDLAPYDLRAINPGVTPPTGTDAHILSGTVTAGSDPTWVTTSPLTFGTLNAAYSETLEATDDGTVTYTITSGSLPTGLSLNESTGVISGTPTATAGNFTVLATDDGGNTNSREFLIPIPLATGGTITASDGFVYHTFTSSDDFEALETIPSAEYILIGGGGGGGSYSIDNRGAGGGGAGGLLPGTASISAGIQTVTIGAGGAENSNGGTSIFGSLGTATGGGAGASADETDNGNNGGSGGGATHTTSPGTANPDSISGLLGFDGGPSTDSFWAGGGGGAGEASTGKNGGDGVNTYSAFGTASGLIFDGGYFAGGGGGGVAATNTRGEPGLGGGGAGTGGYNPTFSGSANSGGGGGGGAKPTQFSLPIEDGKPGGSGVLIVRY